MSQIGPAGGTFWFTLALINAGLAEGKQRSRLAWFLISLLLGPLATFLIVILDPAPPAELTLRPPSCGGERFAQVLLMWVLATENKPSL